MLGGTQQATTIAALPSEKLVLNRRPLEEKVSTMLATSKLHIATHYWTKLCMWLRVTHDWVPQTVRVAGWHVYLVAQYASCQPACERSAML